MQPDPLSIPIAIVPPSLTLLYIYVGVALGLSFLCSLLEAALLSAGNNELKARADAGQGGAARLLRIKETRLDDAISAILTLNTVAHTIGATMAGAEAAKAFGDAWVGVFSGVLTLAVLLGTEIIPKTLGAVHALRLAGFASFCIEVLIRLLGPIIHVTGFITKLLNKGEKPSVTRAEIAALLATAAGQGTLHKDQKRFFDNVLELDKIVVEDVMTPRTVAQMLPLDADCGALLDASAGGKAFSRVPLFKESRDHVVGYVVTRDVLDALARGGSPKLPLKDFQRPTWFLDEEVSIGAALQEFLRRREHMAMVRGDFGSVVGLVTLEDLVETLLGMEIVDESDNTADMRLLAKKIRDARIAEGKLAIESTQGPA
jgi:CBS domain containing-hemolysin-like protein